MEFLLCVRDPEPIEEFILRTLSKRVYRHINVSYFYHYEDFLDKYYQSGTDVVILHCHDNTGDHNKIIELTHKIRSTSPKCFIILTIHFQEDILSYKRELLNSYAFDFLIKSGSIVNHLEAILEKMAIYENPVGIKEILCNDRQWILFSDTLH